MFEHLNGNDFISSDPALVERIDNGKAFQDVVENKKLGLSEALGPDAKQTGLPLGGKLIVVAAASDIAGERMQALNDRLEEAERNGEELCVVVAGAGHYALPPEGTTVEDFDPTKFVNPKYVHAAVTNFSAGNSHTKAFRNPRSDIKYLMASHCAAETLDGNESTIKALMNSEIVPNENIILYDAYLRINQHLDDNNILAATGTGAPPAAIALISALRHQAGITEPLDVEMFGFDGMRDLIHGKIDEMPETYLEHNEVAVRIGDFTAENVQEVYLDQMEELTWMLTGEPHEGLIGSIKVDGENTLTSIIFNNAKVPNMDYTVMTKPDVGYMHRALRG